MEAGVGEQAGFTDDAYRSAGVVLWVQPPRLEDMLLLWAGAATISFLQPATQGILVEALSAHGVTALSLVYCPGPAQGMDALSSQSSLAAYKAMLMAANRLGKFFPMLITAAGTISPAHVLGAGVAGLQTIATACRLGAVVEAYDVRPAVKEEVKNLGATFLELELETQEGGYAHEQSDAFLNRQQSLLFTQHSGWCPRQTYEHGEGHGTCREGEDSICSPLQAVVGFSVTRTCSGAMVAKCSHAMRES